MKELLLATKNKHKVEEISAVLKGEPIKILDLETFGSFPQVVEDGQTIKENAIKKAVEIAKRFKKWTLADDTGLEVDCLDLAPGVYSARFAGKKCTYKDNNKKLLKLMQDVAPKQRTARFRCVIAISDPTGRNWTVEDKIEGVIVDKAIGKDGFGYDPLFYVPSLKKTFAQMDLETKNKISHRGLALKKTKQLLRVLFKRRS